MSTFSVVCGTHACNADCPFCISKMTTAVTGVDLPPPNFDWLRFERAIRYVKTKEMNLNTALITGRGEPTLYKQQLKEIIQWLEKAEFLIELQTNGGMFSDDKRWSAQDLDELCGMGLTTVALSVCSLCSEANQEIMQTTPYVVLPKLLLKLREAGFTVRLTYLLTDLVGPKVKTADWFLGQIERAKALGANQVTFRGIGIPDNNQNPAVYEWSHEHGDRENYVPIMEQIGTRLWNMEWGGVIYDVEGLSVCVADCLTDDPELRQPRSYIFDGKHLRYSWQYEGALIF